MVTSVLGLIFWVLAANLYDAEDVGVATTAVYTMMMLADVACIGLRTGLVRYIPRAGRATTRTILWGYGVVVCASIVTALVFLAGLSWWAPDLVELRNTGLLFIFFVASTAFWALFMLEDAVLVGLRKAPWVPLENSLFGVLKIALLVPFATISPTLGIFWAWTLPVFPVVIGINVLVARVARGRSSEAEVPTVVPEHPPSRSLLRDILAFSIADWLAALARLAALGVIPLMVLAQENRAEAGYFQVSWLIAFTIFALSSNAAYALLAETSYEQARLHRNSMQAVTLSLALTLPVILVGVFGARYLLLIYGSEYAENSTTVLRILLVAAVPNVIHQIYIGRLRAQSRMAAVVFFETLLSVMVVTLVWLFLPRFGIDGVGLAWLIGLSVLAAYAIMSESLWWWASRLDTRLVRRVGSGFRRARSGRPARGMELRLARALPVVGAAGGEVTWLQSSDHGQAAVVAADSGPNVMVSFARSPVGAIQLAKRNAALEALHQDSRLLELGPALPDVIHYSNELHDEFIVSRQPTGRSGIELVRAGVSVDAICRTALDALRPLHEATGRPQTIDQATLDGWIDEPISHLAVMGRASSANLGLLREVFTTDLVGATVEVGRIHGELALDNIVMDGGVDDGRIDEPLRVTQLRRWEWSTELPLVIDPASLALSDLGLRGHVELGQVVRSLLIDPTKFEQHPAMASGPQSPIPTRTTVLLAWLHLVGRPLPPRRTVSSDVFWLARNAQPVLAGLEALVGSRR